MEIDLFLDGYIRWEVGSPDCSVNLHEMFLHATEQGQKEVEQMICQGHWHSLPNLDLQADVSAVQLVGPQPSKEEFKDLYYQVYKLRRLPESPPWGSERMEKLATKIVSFLIDCLGQKGGRPLQGLQEPGLADIQPPRSKTPRRGRRDTSTERDLTKAREGHWKALATMAALVEEIERLSWSVTRGWPGICAHSRSQDCQRRRSQGQNRRHHRVWPEESPAPFFECSPPWWGPGSGEDEEAKPPLLDFDLEPPLELGPEVNHFLQELAGSSEEEEGNRSSPEPLVEDYERWVTWQAWVHNIPGWWLELAKIPDVDDHQELAQKVQVSFELLQQISEWHGVENYLQAPLALPCICQRDFLPQPDPKFACQDIRESQLEKVVAYAQALQFWVEKADPPTHGQPHLLAGIILELREAMECYISFPDDAIFGGVALPEETLTTELEETAPESTQPVSTSCETCRGVHYSPDIK